MDSAICLTRSRPTKLPWNTLICKPSCAKRRTLTKRQHYTTFFIKGIDFSIYHSPTHLHADMIDIALKARWLLVIKEGSLKPASSGDHVAPSKSIARLSWNKSSENIIDAESFSLPKLYIRCKFSYCRSKLLPEMAVKTSRSTFTRTNMLFYSLTLPPSANHPCKICLDQSHQILAWPLFLREALTNLVAIHADNANNDGHFPRRPPRFKMSPGNNSNPRFYNHRHLSSPSCQNTDFLQFTRDALTASKSYNPSKTVQETSIKLVLTWLTFLPQLRLYGTTYHCHRHRRDGK